MTVVASTPGVVSDTGPVNYLLQIAQIDLLRRLFGLVWIPKAVALELTDSGARRQVRDWIDCPPDWFIITEPNSRPRTIVGGAGEQAAIALASERKLPFLCDDEAARRTARREGLLISGTLGVLQQAHARRMIEIVPVMQVLRDTTNFYVSAALFKRVIQEAQVMRNSQ